MKLYHYFRSSASYRVRIALNLKGLAFEALAVDLRPAASEQRSAAFLAINPEGLVPVLIDGGRAFTQSLAIIEYLEETCPQPPLLPRDPAGRARVRALALAIACEISPLNNSGVLAYLRGGPLDGLLRLAELHPDTPVMVYQASGASVRYRVTEETTTVGGSTYPVLEFVES